MSSLAKKTSDEEVTEAIEAIDDDDIQFLMSGTGGGYFTSPGTHVPEEKTTAATAIQTVVQEKFRTGQFVLAICECYQIVGNETPTRLLALVTSSGTNAIFSFSVARLPPECFSDLTIDSVFPMNDDFRIITGNESGGISNLQFRIYYTGGQTTFFYASSAVNGFTIFLRIVQSSHSEFKERLSLASAQGQQSTHSFAWQAAYRRNLQEDAAFSALTIDRSIADGSKPLRKGESKFQDELKKHEHEYIVYKNFRIYCATWNVNGQPCTDISLFSWLKSGEEPPDIYAVAFQELDLSPKAITFNETRPDPIWIRKIMDNLHAGAIYEELKSVRLVGMQLTIIVRKELRPNVTRCWTSQVGTGALNIMGNKGGVGASITINEADLCFVNSHLAAHQNEVERRNEDFAEIIRRLQFGDFYPKLTIDRHDHIFWLGDLNYRINLIPGLTLDYENYKSLFAFDQLRREMAEKHVFQGYTEGEIRFRPTYKYDPGTDNWDSSEKQRAPAWCDRILWRGARIQQLHYQSVMEIRLSDHKPVYSVFECGLKTKDEQKYKRVHEEVLKRVDKYENDNQPQITVEKTDIDFGTIQFNEIAIRDFTVANNCHLPVRFSFKIKNEYDKRICEDWLEVEPKNGELITGSSLSIRIKIFVNSHSVCRLNTKQRTQCGKIPLDILVLDVEDGRDIFITIMGEFKPSCFGYSVETLSRLERPITEMSCQELGEIEKSTVRSACQVTMPREIFLLIDYLYRNGLTEPGIFQSERKYSRNPNINEIRDWLDSWSTTDFRTPHTATETLLMLFESMPDALIHPNEEKIARGEVDSFDQCLNLVQNLSGPRKNVFLYLCMFLREGISRRAFTVNECATIFSNILLKSRPDMQQQQQQLQQPNNATNREDDVRRFAFLHKFLTQNDISKFAKMNINF